MGYICLYIIHEWKQYNDNYYEILLYVYALGSYEESDWTLNWEAPPQKQ